MGYHKNEIVKGTFGQFSKIQEEFDELLDARNQQCKILELCELADLFGAVREYIVNEHGLNIKDLEQMADLTESAFREGHRK